MGQPQDKIKSKKATENNQKTQNKLFKYFHLSYPGFDQQFPF